MNQESPATRQGNVKRVPIRRALISVYDKAGVAGLASGLADAGVQIVSTGSTAKTIAEAGVPVTAVEDVTGFPEILGGRVKTLHPKIHGGLLGDPADPDHAAQLADLGVAPFELLVSNLYPFTQTVASGADRATIVENIDIGGPAMTRAAAKNHANVAVVVDPAGYGAVLDAVRAGGFTAAERGALAATAFAHTAAYDVAVANWFAVDTHPADRWPGFAGQALRLTSTLRYGENPHQLAALYADPADPTGPGLAGAEPLHGKEMSYNNYVDTDAARRAAYDFADPCVAIIKHANPCGIAVADPAAEDPIADAYEKANACDPVSAFGGVIATNRPVTVAMAELVAPVFTEVIVAPDFDEGALDLLTKRKNIRILRCPDYRNPGAEWRKITGGVLVQMPDQVDQAGDDLAGWTLAAGEPADDATLRDLAFAWRAVRAVKSNSILLASGGATVGVGMGQVNRVDAARLAVARAGDRAAGSVAASDAYFPFPDGLEVLTEAGVRAVAQPGGSVRDQLTVDAAAKAGITLYLTGVRHFYH